MRVDSISTDLVVEIIRQLLYAAGGMVSLELPERVSLLPEGFLLVPLEMWGEVMAKLQERGVTCSQTFPHCWALLLRERPTYLPPRKEPLQRGSTSSGQLTGELAPPQTSSLEDKTASSCQRLDAPDDLYGEEGALVAWHRLNRSPHLKPENAPIFERDVMEEK